MKSAHTLLELLVTLTLSTILAAVSWPLFGERLRDARFQAFAGQLTEHLILVRAVAQQQETTTALDLTPDHRTLYRCLVDDETGERVFKERGFAGLEGVAAAVPHALPHPTSSRQITTGLSSTHAPHIRFSPIGASSATVVFSDGPKRVLCAVISSRTGRFRVYRWNAHTYDWEVFF